MTGFKDFLAPSGFVTRHEAVHRFVQRISGANWTDGAHVWVDHQTGKVIADQIQAGRDKIYDYAERTLAAFLCSNELRAAAFVNGQAKYIPSLLFGNGAGLMFIGDRLIIDGLQDAEFYIEEPSLNAVIEKVIAKNHTQPSIAVAGDARSKEEISGPLRIAKRKPAGKGDKRVKYPEASTIVHTALSNLLAKSERDAPGAGVVALRALGMPVLIEEVRRTAKRAGKSDKVPQRSGLRDRIQHWINSRSAT